MRGLRRRPRRGSLRRTGRGWRRFARDATVSDAGSLCFGAVGSDLSVGLGGHGGVLARCPDEPGADRWRVTVMDSRMVTTALELPGYRIRSNLGLVRGLVVRSRSIVGNIGAFFQMLVGGNITLYTELCERARADAYRLMVEHA